MTKRTDNTLPSGILDVMNLAGHMHGGLKLHGPFLKMTQTPAERFLAMLERLRDTERRLGEARLAQGKAGKESVAADKALTKWLVGTRAMLSSNFGRRWNESWQLAGFTHRRTNVPKRLQARIGLASGIVRFLATDPVEEQVMAQVTRSAPGAALARMVAAQHALRMARVETRTRKQARDAAERALRREMRMVVLILGVVIRPEDARWLEFGLNQPRPSSRERRLVVRPTAELPPIETLPLALPAPPQSLPQHAVA